MMRELIFSGDELELLVAMDAAGCVLTDNGKFYCDMDNEKLRYSSRLPARIRGEYAPCEGGWHIRFQVTPGPRTAAIGVIFGVLLASFLISGSFSGAGLFVILSGAVVLNYLLQRSGCVKRFESCLSRGRLE